MEERIRSRYGADILSDIQRRYGIAPSECTALGGFESYIYTVSAGPEEFILRVGHSLRRSVDLVCGEIDWINTLSGHGASVARALPSPRGDLVESIDDGHGGQFLATAFAKVNGVPIWERRWRRDLVVQYGRLLGRMHAVATTYALPNPAWRRPDWDNPIMLDSPRFIPEADVRIASIFAEVIGRLRTLPTPHSGYGLIHQDAHSGNFLVDDGEQIVLFDFDDCAYGWFAYDLAMGLFYRVVNEDDPERVALSFLGPFLEGYREEFTLAPEWLTELPLFLKLREIDLYGVIHRSMDMDALDDPWAARYLRDRRERIENEVPVLGVDFQALQEWL